MYSLSDIPKALRSKSLWDYRWPAGEAGDLLRSELWEYVRGRQEAPGLFLHGPTGVGKTHLLVGVYKVLASFHHHGPDGVTLRFWRRTLDEYRAMVAEHEGWQQACASAASASYLLLDDLTVDGDFEAKVARCLVEEAWDRGTRLMVTSNLPPEEAVKRLDFHAADRLKALCRCVEMTGPSQRRTYGR